MSFLGGLVLKNKLAVCPFCGQKIGFSKLFMMKTKKIYTCEKCFGKSKITLDKNLQKIGFATVVLAALSICIMAMISFITSLWVIFIPLSLFIAFYLYVPFCVNLIALEEDLQTKVYTKSIKNDQVKDAMTEATQVIPSLSQKKFY